MGYEMGDVRVKCAECGRKSPVKRTVEREGRVICWLCAEVDPWQSTNAQSKGTGMNQVQRDEIYRLSGPDARAYIDLLETMGAAAMKFYLLNANMSYPPECLDQLRSSFIRLGWLDEVEEEEDEYEVEGQFMSFPIPPEKVTFIAESRPLHEDVCDACGRVALLSHGLCEGCTIEGMIE